jgi:hypothetical protein
MNCDCCLLSFKKNCWWLDRSVVFAAFSVFIAFQKGTFASGSSGCVWGKPALRIDAAAARSI